MYIMPPKKKSYMNTLNDLSKFILGAKKNTKLLKKHKAKNVDLEKQNTIIRNNANVLIKAADVVKKNSKILLDNEKNKNKRLIKKNNNLIAKKQKYCKKTTSKDNKTGITMN